VTLVSDGGVPRVPAFSFAVGAMVSPIGWEPSAEEIARHDLHLVSLTVHRTSEDAWVYVGDERTQSWTVHLRGTVFRPYWWSVTYAQNLAGNREMAFVAAWLRGVDLAAAELLGVPFLRQVNVHAVGG
jgi:hypothetical protein